MTTSQIERERERGGDAWLNRCMSTVDLRAAGARIEGIVEGLLADHPTVPGIAVALRGPDGSSVNVVRGVADPTTGDALTAAHAYRIASCTKTMVATTVVSLVDDGRVALDQPVIETVADDVAELFARWEHARTVTVRQVLQHRSGLVDHTLFPEFGNAIGAEWTPRTQLAIAVDKPALFAPGAAFSYSDSGYVLLGQMIEHLTGDPLASAVRARAGIDAATMPSMHWEVMEPTPTGLVRAHQLLDGHDTHGWSPTFDLFGGGGLVSTLDDLTLWWSNWFGGVHGHVERHLDGVQPTIGADGVEFPGGTRVGLGVFGRDVNGHAVWSHGGFWGLETGHVPDLGVSYALSITHRTADAPRPHLVGTSVVSALA
jgi:D-alanyl-D-alanine carboxypeptidase